MPDLKTRIPDESAFTKMLTKLVTGKEAEFKTPEGNVKMILADIGFDNIENCLQEVLKTVQKLQQ